MPLWQPANAIARPAYYDRDAIPFFGTYQATLGNHVDTVRATYSPAFPYAAFLEVAMVNMLRATVAGTAFPSYMHLDFFPFFGGVSKTLYLTHQNNVAGSFVQDNLSSFGYLAYGDRIDLITQEGDGGGGTIQFVGSFKGTEFLY